MMKSYTKQRAIFEFWNKVNKTDNPNECWEWQASKKGGGYGQVRWEHRNRGAHVVSWLITFGDIPDKLYVLHSCDNRACCNPNHLFLGTHLDNALDMVKKGRQRKGEKVPQAKLTKSEVIQIRERYKIGGTSQQTLGDEFGVSQTEIGLIVRGEVWKD